MATKKMGSKNVTKQYAMKGMSKMMTGMGSTKAVGNKTKKLKK